MEYFHSVHLDEERCQACTICTTRCPTEAIRVYQGKARILDERCIDCGECMRTCPQEAKMGRVDPLDDVFRYPYAVALIPPSLYSQIPPKQFQVDSLVNALAALGFDAVADVGHGAEHTAAAYKEYLRESTVRPLISSACPAVVRLIQVRFDELLPNVIPIESPMETTAALVRELLQQEGRDPEDIGIFFITPCPAKVTAVKQPAGRSGSNIAGVLSMSDVYQELYPRLNHKGNPQGRRLFPLSRPGVRWGYTAAQAFEVRGTHLSLEGLDQVVEVLDDLSLGKLPGVDFIEANACPGGCIGGCLTVQSRFQGQVNMHRNIRALSTRNPLPEGEFQRRYQNGFYRMALPLESRPAQPLHEDMGQAMQLMLQQEELLRKLPGLDCGACGSPNCKSLAEDIVRGWTTEMDCIFVLREVVQNVAKELWDLAQQVPPTLHKRNQIDDTES